MKRKESFCLTSNQRGDCVPDKPLGQTGEPINTPVDCFVWRLNMNFNVKEARF